MNSISPFLIIAVNSTKVAPGTFKTQDIVRSKKKCNQSNLKLLSAKPPPNQECKLATYSTSCSRSRSSSRSIEALNWLKRLNQPKFYRRYFMFTLDSFSKNNRAKIPPIGRASFLINELESVSIDRNRAIKPSRSPLLTLSLKSSS